MICTRVNPALARPEECHLPQRHVGDWYLDGGVLHRAGVRVRVKG